MQVCTSERAHPDVPRDREITPELPAVLCLAVCTGGCGACSWQSVGHDERCAPVTVGFGGKDAGAKSALAAAVVMQCCGR